MALIIGALFWAGFLVSRGSAAWTLRHVSEPLLYTTSLALSTLGAGLVLISQSLPLLTVGAVIAGIGLAPLYPLTVSMIAADSDSAGADNAGWVFAFAGLGGALLPWLAGRIAGATGSLSLAFWVPLAGLALLSALFVWHRRRGTAANASSIER